ncbi:Wzt carbohydrate-binding domain-containing protein, partial [Pseudomonas viridiflava]
YWGIHIRNISGAVVTGQRYPEEGVYMENVRAGSQFSVKFSFTMSLLPGAYFAGAGIWSAQEPNSVHRILDAIMFRVSPNERLNSFGYVCLASSAPAVEMN